MKILVIANSFPPFLDSEALCSGKFVLALMDAGHDVKIITQGNAEYEGKIDTSEMWNKLEENICDRISIPTSVFYRKSKSFWSKLLFLFPGATWWSLKAVCRGKEILKKEKFDLILSRGTTIECLYVGYKLGKITGTRLVSILNDPPFFCFPSPYINRKKNIVARKLDLYKLKKIFHNSFLNVFPSNRLVRYMENILHINLTNKTFISPHIGFYDNYQSVHSNDLGFLSILHAGKIDWGRSSLPFLRALRNALNKCPDMHKKLKCHFMGIQNDLNEKVVKDLGLSEVIIFDGFMSYEDSLKMISKANALLLIEAIMKEGIFLPSKFCDYAVTKKPLLLFSPKNGTIADIVGMDNHALLGQDEEEVTQALTAFFEAWSNKKNLKDYIYPQAENFSSKRVIGDLLNKLR